MEADLSSVGGDFIRQSTLHDRKCTDHRKCFSLIRQELLTLLKRVMENLITNTRMANNNFDLVHLIIIIFAPPLKHPNAAARHVFSMVRGCSPIS